MAHITWQSKEHSLGTTYHKANVGCVLKKNKCWSKD